MDTEGKFRVIAALRTRDTESHVAAAFRDLDNADVQIFSGSLTDLFPRIMNSHAPEVLLVDIPWDTDSEIRALEAFMKIVGQRKEASM